MVEDGRDDRLTIVNVVGGLIESNKDNRRVAESKEVGILIFVFSIFFSTISAPLRLLLRMPDN